METNIGIVDHNSQSVMIQLSKILAEEYILIIKTKNAHWNIEGSDFIDKNIFFEYQYEKLDVIIESVAERIRSLGDYVPANFNSFLSLTQLPEMSRENSNSNGYIKALLADHESIIVKLHENIHPFVNDFHDTGTSDFITGLMEDHEKIAWYLRSHLL